MASIINQPANQPPVVPPKKINLYHLKEDSMLLHNSYTRLDNSSSMLERSSSPFKVLFCGRELKWGIICLRALLYSVISTSIGVVTSLIITDKNHHRLYIILPIFGSGPTICVIQSLFTWFLNTYYPSRKEYFCVSENDEGDCC